MEKENKGLSVKLIKYTKEIVIGVVSSILTAVVLSWWDRITLVAPQIGKSFLSTVINAVYANAATYTSDTFSATVLKLFYFVPIIFLFIFHWGMVERMVKNRKKQAEEKDKKQIIKKKSMNDWIAISCRICVLCLLCALAVVYVWEPIQLRVEFERDIIIIAPYVEEHDLLQLESDWMCMKSKEDYDRIYMLIDSVKDNQSLPK